MINLYEDTSASVAAPRSPRWWRWTLDVVIVALLLGINAVSVGPGNESHVPSRTLWLTSIVVLPLLVRRRWPVQVCFTILAICALQFVLVIPLRPGNMAPLIGIYTLYAYRGGRLADIAAGIAAVGLVAEFVQVHTENWFTLIPPAVVFAAVVVTGRTIRTRRVYLAALEERAVRLEVERDALARAAVAEERARIAREMHDVVAHRVGVIVAQADGATYAFEAHPEQARAALDVIAASGRAALTELRQMLGVLRSTEESGTAPQPGVVDIDALVAEMRAAGLPVRFTASGSSEALEASVSLTVYRVVQEALTNTLKHAGPGTPVEVTIDRTPSSVRVRVLDEGNVSPDEAGPIGHGLIGMRERVSMLGGTFSAVQATPGGFAVNVTIPLETAISERIGE